MVQLSLYLIQLSSAHIPLPDSKKFNMGFKLLLSTTDVERNMYMETLPAKTNFELFKQLSQIKNFHTVKTK